MTICTYTIPIPTHHLLTKKVGKEELLVSGSATTPVLFTLAKPGWVGPAPLTPAKHYFHRTNQLLKLRGGVQWRSLGLAQV